MLQQKKHLELRSANSMPLKTLQAFMPNIVMQVAIRILMPSCKSSGSKTQSYNQ